ncbi:phosphomannomutase/phosphoglucomutase [Candidatus Uhrbacteria bacterium]|nr:phosphomannomutase/phosphoglucomutase [Candidatus Uhrbacteria bacterium]
MHASIFKSYDIRGLAPQEIHESVARRLGKALAFLYQPKQVVVGRDMRETSPALEDALVEGLIASGVTVTRIGLCSTPMFNFAVGESNGVYDLGVMVTASHNPAAYNGFKLTKAGCIPIGEGSGMEEIKTLMISDEPLLDHPVQGKILEDTEVLGRYLQHIFDLVHVPAKFPAWRIAIDAGSGMGGVVLPSFCKRLTGLQVTPLYWEPDGSFPFHEANPLKSETLTKVRETVVNQGCVFGVAYDGDCDRVGFIDEQGTPIPGDLLTALLGRELLRERPGSTILYDLRSSWSVPECIQKAGGRPSMCRVGHAHIKRQMREEQGMFGGELSMHFYFSDLWNAESGDLAMLYILRMMLREQKPLSVLWKDLKTYAHSGEINFTVKSQATTMQNVEERFRAVATDISYLDGLRMEFRSKSQPEDDWWFNVRASNTEPLLRLNVEARTAEKMEMHKKELITLITA